MVNEELRKLYNGTQEVYRQYESPLHINSGIAYSHSTTMGAKGHKKNYQQKGRLPIGKTDSELKTLYKTAVTAPKILAN
jgi:hypothetical protein